MGRDLILFILVVLLVSCTGSAVSEKRDVDSNHTGTDRIGISTHETVDTFRFSNISFVSGIDTSCGMPLSAGVTDTMSYQGKIYGFCSPGCKQEFASQVISKSRAGQDNTVATRFSVLINSFL
ncbi:YHS domain-containing protein [Niabella yanshanensis]|uniref:YHS domain-containing protein n=1 Tax=Niabella yanshanensis TaxID=577386 RepID=A0ABZ0W4P8_9BACT|nr:YHS domain-containing protein [Niabella yanshanensis]WQD38197.1 YHS domain-containing protein [Niabella yanshanensis]